MQLHVWKHCPHNTSHYNGTWNKHIMHSRKELIPGLMHLKVWLASRWKIPTVASCWERKNVLMHTPSLVMGMATSPHRYPGSGLSKHGTSRRMTQGPAECCLWWWYIYLISLYPSSSPPSYFFLCLHLTFTVKYNLYWWLWHMVLFAP